jgi:exonuclease III
VSRREADVVCLQEVRPSTVGPWRKALGRAGLPHVLDSSRFAAKGRLFNLTAARWPVDELSAVGSPQPERVLSVVIEAPTGPIDVHNAHVPPAQSNGFAKVETCEALFERLSRPRPHGAVLIGDLNTPRREYPDGSVETFASNHPEHAARWDAAERSLLTGLGEFGFRDAFRTLNGYDRDDVSWVMHTRARRKAAHRLDHVIASSELEPVACDYIHGWREAGLSDHSAMEATFRVGGRP